jgi:hypothetical protein
MRTIFRRQCDEESVDRVRAAVKRSQWLLCDDSNHRQAKNGEHTTDRSSATASAAFPFRAQESRTVADFSFSRRAINVTRVTDSSVYDLGSALIGRGVGRMTPRRLMNVDAVQHHPAARE